ncbi:MAG: hypothetical protein PSN44_08365 [Gammaproteobacteria bacterium]|nr:hypothetical protein [Gammaproteobacteria bacterium]
MKSPFHWDSYSDQPHIIKDKAYKRRQKKKHFFSYIGMFLLFFTLLPVILMLHFFVRKAKKNGDIGLGVNLDKGSEQYHLVDELGVSHLIIRIPLWEMERLDEYVEFIKGFVGKSIVVNILQDREHIEDHALLERDVKRIFHALNGRVTEFQIGNAVNRAKWGFFSMSEYLAFYQRVQTVRDSDFPEIKLIGPSVIDFEYYYTSSALFNFKKLRFDALSALLYVDRRGSPYNPQYWIFDTQFKITVLKNLMRLSRKVSDKLYLTEANWPLSGTAPYAPTSETECIDEQTYAEYMHDYLMIVLQSGEVDRVYWHQLIAPGYGLVDNRHGQIRKMPAFEVFKEMIAKREDSVKG